MILAGAEGTALTVIDLLTIVEQPLIVTAYLIFVVPDVTPVTNPLFDTVATAAF